MSIDFSGRKVLIVGGSSGIGLATAQAALDLGAKVTISSRNLDQLRDAASRLSNSVSTLPVDITENKMVDALFAASEAFDHIVVSAASTKTGPVRELPLEDAYAAMDSKFWGAYRVARAARINENGSLTLVSGFLSKRPSVVAVLQGAINAALEGLVRGLALEFAPVRVNAVSPGIIDTPLYSGLSEEKRILLFENARHHRPARRVGAAEDVAHAILFLAGNPFATGTVVTLDGGGSIAQ